MNIIDLINPEVITITKNDLNFFEKVLHALGFNIAKEFKIKEPNLFNVFRISSIVNKFDMPENATLKFDEGVLRVYVNGKEASFTTHTKFITENLTRYIQIITLALQSNNKRLDKRIYKYVMNNLSRNELEKVLSVVLSGAKLGFFLPSSILIKQEAMKG